MVLSGLQSGARGRKSSFCDLACRSNVHPEGTVGKQGYRATLFQPRRRMVVGVRRHAPSTLPPGKTLYSLYKRLASLDGCGKTCPHRGSNTWSGMATCNSADAIFSAWNLRVCTHWRVKFSLPTAGFNVNNTYKCHIVSGILKQAEEALNCW